MVREVASRAFERGGRHVIVPQDGVTDGLAARTVTHRLGGARLHRAAEIRHRGDEGRIADIARQGPVPGARRAGERDGERHSQGSGRRPA